MKIPKYWILAFAVLFLTSYTSPQKTPGRSCSNLVLNLEKGKLNKLFPTASQEEVKKIFPCYTGASEDGAKFNCGGGVFFLKNDFFFYTGRNYIETRTEFTGKFKPDISAVAQADIETKLGKAALKPDANTYLFERKYGTLRVEYANGKLSKVAVHAVAPKAVKLCR